MSKSLRIVGLQVENVKRLKAVRITPSGNVVKVGGRNAQGKSSLLDAIEGLFGGKDAQQPEMIRRGAERARTVADLGEIVVERKYTKKDSYIEVRGKDGRKYSSPQTILDKLYSSLSFDPVAYMRQDPKKQVATLRQLVGVDTTQLDQERAAVYDQRTQVNRDAALAEAKLTGIAPVDAPDEEVSLQDLLSEREVLAQQVAENSRARAKVDEAKRLTDAFARELAGANVRVQELEEQLARARDKVDSITRAAEDAKTSWSIAVANATGLVDPDLAALDAELRGVEEANRRVRAKKARAVEAQRLAQLQAKSAALTEQLQVLDQERQTLIAGAKFPVPGMGFGDEGITLNGLPLEQASAAEQLRLSLAMGLALNPELKVMLIRDGSLLDEDSLALVEQMAAAAGAQVWIEVVGKAGDVSVVIEDGEASGPDAEPPQVVA